MWKVIHHIYLSGDIASKVDLARVFEQGIDVVINFAAESHVDRSILDPDAFIQTNINGTFNLLEEVRKREIKRFIQISTDEVYGSLGKEGKFTSLPLLHRTVLILHPRLLQICLPWRTLRPMEHQC